MSYNEQIYNTMDGGKYWDNVGNISGMSPHGDLNTIEAGDRVDTPHVSGRITTAIVNLSAFIGTPLRSNLGAFCG